MGYSASIKCFVQQLGQAQPLGPPAADQFQLHGCAFSRVWVQARSCRLAALSSSPSSLPLR